MIEPEPTHGWVSKTSNPSPWARALALRLGRHWGSNEELWRILDDAREELLWQLARAESGPVVDVSAGGPS